MAGNSKWSVRGASVSSRRPMHNSNSARPASASIGAAGRIRRARRCKVSSIGRASLQRRSAPFGPMGQRWSGEQRGVGGQRAFPVARAVNLLGDAVDGSAIHVIQGEHGGALLASPSLFNLMLTFSTYRFGEHLRRFPRRSLPPVGCRLRFFRSWRSSSLFSRCVGGHA